MKYLIIFFFIVGVPPVCAQQNTTTIRFLPECNELPLQTGKKYVLLNDSVEIEVLRFYISGIQFYQDDQLAGAITKQHHLIDMNLPSTQVIPYPNEKNIPFNRVVFMLGVDSATNESGAFGGDLDPTSGMYWEWRSGYINFKLEGNSRLCPARKNHFTFHIGGYQYPFNTIQQVSLTVKDQTTIDIGFSITNLLQQIGIGDIYEVMSPNEKAAAISKKIAASFYIKP